MRHPQVQCLPVFNGDTKNFCQTICDDVFISSHPIPAKNRHGEIVSYEVTYQNKSGSQVSRSVDPTQTWIRVPDLDLEQEYQFYVKANTNKGSSDPSQKPITLPKDSDGKSVKWLS